MLSVFLVHLVNSAGQLESANDTVTRNGTFVGREKGALRFVDHA